MAVVISNNSGSGALERARRAGVPACHLSGRTHPDPQALDRAIADVFQSYGVDLVVLGGYMKKLGPVTLQAYPNRILNIHPALLPAFGGKGMYGLRVHHAVIESGAWISGVTAHLADEDYDHGPIVAQEAVRVDPDDTPESLAARVLEVEHRLYSEVIRLFAEGRVAVQGRRVRILERT
jgi:phosphoribosylglycinamide formyltransferase-1